VGAALCIAWAGNPEGITQAIRLWHAPGPFNWAGYDFWSPTRPTPFFIIEFPAFSAILGDFHSHHLALPWLVGWLALALGGRRWSGASALTGVHHHAQPHDLGRSITWGILWIALALASMLTNLWNLPLIGFAAGLFLVFTLQRGSTRAFSFQLALSLGLAVLVFFGFRLLRSGAPLPLPADATQSFLERLPVRLLDPKLRTSLWILFSLWGLPVFALALGALVRVLRRPRRLADWIALGLVLLGAGLIWAVWPPAKTNLPGGTMWAWVAVSLWALSLMIGRRPWLARPLGLTLIAGCAVLAGLELMYVRDRFVGDLARYNSYFKFSYPVWPVLWLGAWLVGRRLWRMRAALPLAWGVRAVLVGLLAVSMIYTALAIPAHLKMARYADDPPRGPSLNAYDFIRHKPPYDTEAPMMDWIRRNVPPGDRVAEAAAPDPYSYGGRVASLAGRPVPVGWAHHEHQWRGPASYGPVSRVQLAVEQFYRAPSPEVMRQRAGALGVRWALFGIQERKQYGDGPLNTLKQAASLVAEFPEGRPEIFLFDFRDTPRSIKVP
jgi:uncharacterized membrane protein